MTQTQLAEVYRALGFDAEEAEQYAACEKSWPQLAKTLFLTLAWRLIIDPKERRGGEPAWIEEWFRWARSQKQPQEGVGAALERVLAKGVDPDDLTRVVRAMQFDVLLNLCDLLDGEGVDELLATLPGKVKVDWRLFELKRGKPARAIESLHEEVYRYDPTGAEGQ